MFVYIYSIGVHGPKDTVSVGKQANKMERGPGQGRGNALETDDAGPVFLQKLRECLCLIVDVFRLISLIIDDTFITTACPSHVLSYAPGLWIAFTIFFYPDSIPHDKELVKTTLIQSTLDEKITHGYSGGLTMPSFFKASL